MASEPQSDYFTVHVDAAGTSENSDLIRLRQCERHKPDSFQIRPRPIFTCSWIRYVSDVLQTNLRLKGHDTKVRLLLPPLTPSFQNVNTVMARLSPWSRDYQVVELIDNSNTETHTDVCRQPRLILQIHSEWRQVSFSAHVGHCRVAGRSHRRTSEEMWNIYDSI